MPAELGLTREARSGAVLVRSLRPYVLLRQVTQSLMTEQHFEELSRKASIHAACQTISPSDFFRTLLSSRLASF
jgi:hypothetical protein